MTIRDDRVRWHVEERTRQGYQWPGPWLSLNPNVVSGGSLDDRIDEGLLAAEPGRVFRLKPGPDHAGRLLWLHRHQRDAIEIARDGHSYVLTIGIGSCKSLAYLLPIVNRILQAKADGSYRPCIKAIIVYPMNALANSQLGELDKFVNHGDPNGRGPVSFRRYTGQESREERHEIMAEPPDTLLINYVMLELVLTRRVEWEKLSVAADGLWFLVLDELHTCRGRQSADVAFLVRRTRDARNAPHVQCIGTSAHDHRGRPKQRAASSCRGGPQPVRYHGASGSRDQRKRYNAPPTERRASTTNSPQRFAPGRSRQRNSPASSPCRWIAGWRVGSGSPTGTDRLGHHPGRRGRTHPHPRPAARTLPAVRRLHPRPRTTRRDLARHPQPLPHRPLIAHPENAVAKLPFVVTYTRIVCCQG